MERVSLKIPYNRPTQMGKEIEYIQQAIDNGHLSGNGPFTKGCQTWLEEKVGCLKVLLTHSCTAALEMAAILADVQHGDEVIMPSFTFVSTANAFVLRGVVPVFVDIRPDTLNMDETRIAAAITPKTKAIVPVHYSGVGCEMDSIMSLAAQHQLIVIEDAAQGIMAEYKGAPLGSIGHLAALSFHETKNVISGEGGALLVNADAYLDRAEIIWEKGTNRANFFRGQVDKYTWVDIGSSYLPSEIIAAFLYAQLEEIETISRKRMDIWNRYHAAFEALETQGIIRRPVIPAHCKHNAHLYYLLLPDIDARTAFLSKLRDAGIHAIFHYIPLHSSPAGLKYGRSVGDLAVTDQVSDRLVRLPLWINMTDGDIDQVIDASYQALKTL
jgi:dTDP-4-amino-4,6-dideoxygalactose transaminase